MNCKIARMLFERLTGLFFLQFDLLFSFAVGEYPMPILNYGVIKRTSKALGRLFRK